MGENTQQRGSIMGIWSIAMKIFAWIALPIKSINRTDFQILIHMNTINLNWSQQLFIIFKKYKNNAVLPYHSFEIVL